MLGVEGGEIEFEEAINKVDMSLSSGSMKESVIKGVFQLIQTKKIYLCLYMYKHK